MPNCTAPQVPFTKLGRREIDARFNGGDVSSDGGLLLLRQVERRLVSVANSCSSRGRSLK